MKRRLNLRVRYLGWMLLLLFGSNLILIISLLIFNLYQALFRGGNHAEEVGDFFFMLSVLLMLSPALVWGAHLVASRLLEPLDKVLDAADSIGSGDLHVRVPPIDVDPRLDLLGRKVNRAFDRYAAAIQQLEAFSTHASHQLRTPLAAIHTSAELAISRPQSVEVYEETLSDILQQSDKLKLVVEQMLLMARIEGMGDEQLAPLAFCESVRGWAKDFDPVAASLGLQLQWHCEGPVAVHGNAVLLREAFVNLLENAFAHTPAGGRIEVRLSRCAEERLQLNVEDSGPGIPEAEREKVFERFYRLESACSHGAGLGLAIVRLIAQRHGGSVRAEHSATLGGAAIILELPILPQSAA